MLLQAEQSVVEVQVAQWVRHTPVQSPVTMKKPELHVAQVVALGVQVAQLPEATPAAVQGARIRVGASRRTAITITFILIINLKAHGLNTLFDAI